MPGERAGHRVHRVAEIREGLAYARTGLAICQPPGIKKEERSRASVPGKMCALTREPEPSDVAGIRIAV